MTSGQLSRRLGVARQTCADYEISEVEGTIQLATLRRAADALGCELVYAFVPRTSFEEIVNARALERARSEIMRIDHTMLLEDQRPDPAWTTERIAERAEELRGGRDLWAD